MQYLFRHAVAVAILTMAPSAVSAETVLTLETLLHEARSGRLVGIAYVAMHPGGGFEVDAVGEAKRQPIVARGELQSLDDQLGHLVGSK